ncbi:hypothetical protein [Microbacterium sp. NPDC077486]|uniref:hypothetical protein n=1 Tax=Microbacterium sp. NPDC077486 TaxID=3154766 RepID=UPI00344845C3
MKSPECNTIQYSVLQLHSEALWRDRVQVNKTVLWGVVGAGVAIFLVVICAVLVIPALTKTPGPGDQFEFPISWQRSKDPDVPDAANTTIELYADGTAQLSGISLGHIETSADARLCVADASEGDAGDARWEVDDDGVLHVRSVDGEAVFLPGAGRFSGSDWSELREPFCDETFVDFSPSRDEAEDAAARRVRGSSSPMAPPMSFAPGTARVC